MSKRSKILDLPKNRVAETLEEKPSNGTRPAPTTRLRTHKLTGPEDQAYELAGYRGEIEALEEQRRLADSLADVSAQLVTALEYRIRHAEARRTGNLGAVLRLAIGTHGFSRPRWDEETRTLTEEVQDAPGPGED